MKQEAIRLVFYNGFEYEFNVTAKNKSTTSQAQNVTVTFKLYKEFPAANGNPIVEPDVVVSAVTLPTGSFSGGVWTIGNMPANTTHVGTFKFTVNSDEVNYVEIDIKGETTSGETEITNNLYDKYIPAIRQVDLLTGSREKVYEVPIGAFADPTDPTEAEVRTWVDANITNNEELNGTLLNYVGYSSSPLPTYQNFSVVVDTSLAASITAVHVNRTIGNTSFNISSSDDFDEAAFQTYIEGLMTTAGVTGTVSVTDDIDGTNTVTLNITTQNGIWKFQLWLGLTKIYYPATVDKSFEVDYRLKPRYIYQLNSNGVDYTVTNIFKDKIGVSSGNKFFIDITGGSDEEGEINSKVYPFKTLDYVVNRMARPGDKIYIKYNRSITTGLTIVGLDLTGLEINVYVDGVEGNFDTINIFEHSSDSSTVIYVDGYMYKLLSQPFVAINHASYLDGSLVLGAKGGFTCILNSGSTPATDMITSSVGSKEIIIHDVRTNSNILDANAVEFGNAIVRNTNFSR